MDLFQQRKNSTRVTIDPETRPFLFVVVCKTAYQSNRGLSDENRRGAGTNVTKRTPGETGKVSAVENLETSYRRWFSRKVVRGGFLFHQGFHGWESRLRK